MAQPLVTVSPNTGNSSNEEKDPVDLEWKRIQRVAQHFMPLSSPSAADLRERVHLFETDDEEIELHSQTSDESTKSDFFSFDPDQRCYCNIL